MVLPVLRSFCDVSVSGTLGKCHFPPPPGEKSRRNFGWRFNPFSRPRSPLRTGFQTFTRHPEPTPRPGTQIDDYSRSPQQVPTPVPVSRRAGCQQQCGRLEARAGMRSPTPGWDTGMGGEEPVAECAGASIYLHICNHHHDKQLGRMTSGSGCGGGRPGGRDGMAEC